MAEARDALAATAPVGDDGGSAVRRARFAQQRFSTQDVASVLETGQRGQAGDDDIIWLRFRRSDDAGDKGRDVQLMVGAEDQRRIDQSGGGWIGETPAKGEGFGQR